MLIRQQALTIRGQAEQISQLKEQSGQLLKRMALLESRLEKQQAVARSTAGETSDGGGGASPAFTLPLSV